MSVNVIDTIKPKNGGSFPVVEAVDVSVSGGVRLDTALAAKADNSDIAALESEIDTKADNSALADLGRTLNNKADKSDISELRATIALKAAQSSLDATNATVANKANITDIAEVRGTLAIKANQSSLDATNVVVASKANQTSLEATNATIASKVDKTELEATANELQAQIDEIVVSASAEAVVAPEVVAARVDASGVTHETLKARIDADYIAENDKIDDINADVYEFRSEVFGGYGKPVGLGSDTVSDVSKIWFQYADPAHITKIQFKAKEGTINFYKVHYVENASSINYDLIEAVANTAGEDGTIKSISVDVTLEANDYIGVNGDFYFKTTQTIEYYSRNAEIPTGHISNKQHQYLDFIAYYDGSINQRVSELEDSVEQIEGYEEITEKNTEDITELRSEVLGGFGKENGMGNDSVVNTDRIWFQYADPIHVTKISFTAKEGTTNFYKVRYIEGDSSSFEYELIASIENSAADEGNVKSFDVDVQLGDNEYIGINGAFFFKSSGTAYYARNYELSSGSISNKHNQYLDFVAVYEGALSGKVEELEKTVEDIEERIDGSGSTVRKHGEVVLYNHKFVSSDSDFDGTQAFNSYGLNVTSNVYLKKAYAVSDRTVKYLCKFNTGSIAHFDVVQENGTTVNTRITLNVTTKKLTLLGKPAQNCPVLNTTDEFLVTITKKYQDMIITVTDIYTGAENTFKHTMSGTGGAGEGAVEVDKSYSVPMQHCYYALNADSGTSFSVSKMIVVCAKCNLLVYGDSITEGEAYWPHDIFDKHWAQKLIKATDGKALTSGRSGGNFNDIYVRMQNEIPFIKPKYVMITTGTNGAGTVSNYTTLVQYVKAQGCIPILNHIPCYDNNGDTTGFITTNANIDAVRTSENVKGADFDLATSLAHNGQAVDTTSMWYEDYSSRESHYYHHPNEKGCAAMYQRLLIDVPEIFDI